MHKLYDGMWEDRQRKNAGSKTIIENVHKINTPFTQFQVGTLLEFQKEVIEQRSSSVLHCLSKIHL